MGVSGARGVIIAASRSGAGKTTVTLGLLRALRRAGVPVQPYKCGPDYIDPAFHAAGAGRASVNLDTWAMRQHLIGALVAQHSRGADLSVVEGVMGLFDGAPERGQCGNGSTADLAALTGWPVILVLDVTAQAETAAAIALGCATYRNDITIAGVILNRVGSEGHARVIAQAMARRGMPVLGALKRDETLTLPERHLGLVQACETAELDMTLERVAETVGAAVQIAEIVAAARPMRLADGESPAPLPPPGKRIALAQDRAFSFVYPHILAGWRQAGAEICPFSPLADETPDAECDAVWLPGGYPELHAPALAAAARFKAGLHASAARGAAIHGECGGYMALGAGIVTADGARYEMAGLLGLETSFAKRRLHLGYRRARCLGDDAGAFTGRDLFGHEFHYATVTANPDQPLANIADANGSQLADSGSRRGSVTGTFFHLIDGAP
jgi:cobyrinic acid a,c-diamide synthase